MKVNMDELRKQATHNVNELGELIDGLKYSFPTETSNELIEKFNNVARSVDIMNCVYSNDKEEDMFNDISGLVEAIKLDEQ